MNKRSHRCDVSSLAALLLLSARLAGAASGTWLGTQNSLWTNSANWSASPYAGYSTSESATFNSAGNGNTNLNLTGLFSLMNITFDTAGVAAYTVGSGAPNSQRVVIGNNGTYKLTSSAANDQTFLCAVMLGGGSTTGSYTFQNDNTNRLLTFNSIYVTNVLTTAGTKTLTLAGAGALSILGHITKNTASGITLNKTGAGLVTFAGTNVIASLNVNAGVLSLTGASGALVTSGLVSVASGATLRLDNGAASHPNRLFDASPVILAGGALDFSHAGGAASYGETVGPVTLSGAGCSIRTAQADEGQTSALTLSALVRNTGATVDFAGAGLGENGRNRVFIAGQADGPLGTWATVNGASPALYDSASGVYLQGKTEIAAHGSVIESNDTANVWITSEGSGGSIQLAEPVTIIGALTQDTAFDATVDTAGKTLRLGAATINPAMAGLTLGAAPGDGFVAPRDAGGALNLVSGGAGALTVNAVVADCATASSLVKSGVGSAVLAGDNTYSGETEIQEGTLTLVSPDALAGTSLLRLTGTSSRSAVLEIATAGGDAPFPLAIGPGYVGTVASGAGAGGVGLNHTLGDLSLSRTTLTVCRASSVLSGSPAVTFGALDLSGGGAYVTTLLPTDADLHLGSASIASGSYAKTLRLDGSSLGSTIDGPVSNGLNTLTLHKAGPGAWTLLGSNSYSGATAVYEGTLTVAGAAGALAASSGYAVYTGATLRLSGTASASHPDRLADAKALTLSGGALDFSHPADAADYSESVGAVTLAAGTTNAVAASRAASGRTSTLTLASLTRSADAAVDFQGDGLGADSRNRLFVSGLTPGLIGPWATYNGAGLAAYDAANGVCAGTASTTDIAARGPGSEIPDDATADVRITSAGTSGPITLAGPGETRAGRLQQCAGTAAAVDTSNAVFRVHALQIQAGQAALTVGLLEGDGTLTALASGGRLDLVNDAAEALTIRASVADNGSASSLAKSGAGDVVLCGPASYSGTTSIGAGALTFGGHAFPQTLAGVISGAGALAKSGTNVLHLLAANTYAGPTTISAGTLRVNQNAALGTAASGTFIADGATLDVGCSSDVGGTRVKDTLNMQTEPLTAQGAGVGGRGAIVNSSTTSQYNALGKLTLAADTVVGGNARWDVRDSWLVMNDHKLTKVGPSVVSLSSSTNAPGEAGAASIDVREGQFRLQRTASLGGGAANVLTVRAGAEFELYEVTSDVAWSLALEDGAALDALGSTAVTQNRLAGPASLAGAVRLVGGDGEYVTLAGDLSGPGSLVKTNGSVFLITGTNNTYAGPTRIHGGSLRIASLRNIGEPCSLGQPADAASATVSLGAGSTSARLTYIGSGGSSDRAIDLAGTTGAAYLEQSGEGRWTLKNLTVSGAGSKTLYLEGSASGEGEISANITNGPSGVVAVNKNGTGAWLLSGQNSYGGSTTMDGGSLTFAGTNVLAALAINAGTVTVLGTNAHGSANLSAGASGKNGTLILGPGASLSGSGDFRFGNSGGNGALVIDGGSVLRTQSAGDQNFVFARENNSYGYLRVTAGRATAGRLQMSGVTGSSNIGRSLARILGGTLTFSDYMLVGRNPGCETVLTVEGGAINHGSASQNLTLGYAGGRAELNLTGGSLNNSGRLVSVLQGGGSAATGIVNLCAGTLTTLAITNYANGVATVNFAGGTLAASANHAAFLAPSLTGVYIYAPFGACAGGAVVDTAGRNVTLPVPLLAPAGQGVTAIALAETGSGYIGEPYVSIEGDGAGATAVANLEDDGTGQGTYRVASVTLTCPGRGYTVAPAVLFKGGGATNALVAAAAGSVTLGANGSGGLTKQGAGTLTLGAANTYTGTTAVAGGTLKLGHPAALPTGAPVVLASGTLDLGGYAVTNAVSGSGTLANGTVQTVVSPAGEGAVGVTPFNIALASAALYGTYRADVTAGGESDLWAVQGDIDLASFDFRLVDPEQLDRHSTYTLLTCTGTRTGTFASHNLPSARWHLSYSTDGSVMLLYSGGTLLRVR